MIREYDRSYSVRALYLTRETDRAEITALARDFRVASWMWDAGGYLIGQPDGSAMWVDADQFRLEFTPKKKEDASEHHSEEATQASGSEVRSHSEDTHTHDRTQSRGDETRAGELEGDSPAVAAARVDDAGDHGPSPSRFAMKRLRRLLAGGPFRRPTIVGTRDVVLLVADEIDPAAAALISDVVAGSPLQGRVILIAGSLAPMVVRGLAREIKAGGL